MVFSYAMVLLSLACTLTGAASGTSGMAIWSVMFMTIAAIHTAIKCS